MKTNFPEVPIHASKKCILTEGGENSTMAMVFIQANKHQTILQVDWWECCSTRIV